jgi:ABC-type Mn2+/Zn2+ transport system ATPase subunit
MNWIQQQQILYCSILKELAAAGKSVVMITHDKKACTQ